MSANESPVVLITGAGIRVGAATARRLHAHGWRVLLHCRRSREAADTIAAELNTARPDSAFVVVADLNDRRAISGLATAALAHWQRLDALVNNASTFYATPIGSTRDEHWDDLFASNAHAPFFLTQALAPALAERGQGAVVNVIDIHADYPLAGHTLYCMAKAALAAMTKSLAKELAPAVRVNAVSPGAILWPEGTGEMSATQQTDILASIPLARLGGVEAIAEVIEFLLNGTHYVSGQIIAADGGRSVWG